LLDARVHQPVPQRAETLREENRPCPDHGTA
jgi:hypothetical protein